MDVATSYVKTFALNLKAMYDESSFKQVITKVRDSYKKVDTLPVNFDNEKIAEDLKKAVEKARNSVDNILDFANESKTLSQTDKEAASKKYDKQIEALYKIKQIQNEIIAQEMFGNDVKTLKQLKKQLKKLKKEAKEVGLDEDKDGNFSQRTTEEQVQIDKQIDKQSDFRSGWKEAKQSWATNRTTQQYGIQAFQKMTSSIEQFKNKALKTFKNFVEDALKELEEMASWNIADSTKYNSKASEMYMNYGLQGADAYAMNKALEATGIDNIETYLTDPIVRGNQTLLNAFNEQYEIAKEQYENDIETAKEYQEFQKELDLFKQELQKSLIDFFMENKDTIMSILNFLMKAMQWLVDLVGEIVEFFGGDTMKDRSNEQRQSDMNELLGVTNNSTISYDNRSNKVEVNNTYNGVGKVDQGMLQNVGQMTYQQIIEYLGRE